MREGFWLGLHPYFNDSSFINRRGKISICVQSYAFSGRCTSDWPEEFARTCLYTYIKRWKRWSHILLRKHTEESPEKRTGKSGKVNWNLRNAEAQSVVHGVNTIFHVVNTISHAVNTIFHAVNYRLGFGLRRIILRSSGLSSSLFRTCPLPRSTPASGCFRHPTCRKRRNSLAAPWFSGRERHEKRQVPQNRPCDSMEPADTDTGCCLMPIP